MKYIIKESQYISLLENLDKNKKFLTKIMGVDFTGKIKEIKDSYDVPMSFDEGVDSNLINIWLNLWGPMYLVNVKGKDYLYQKRGDYEMFIDEEGYDSVDDEIPEQLGISVLGLRFSDIINMYFNEEEPLNESVDKNKRLLIDVMGEDLTGKIKEIKDGSDIPKRFRKYLELGNVKQQIDMVGPMYLVKIRGNYYLYQDQSKFYQSHNDSSFGEQFWGEDGKRDRSGKILEELGLDVLGLRFSDIIDMFYNKEEPLNENVDKNKKFLTKTMGIDFANKIQMITSTYDVPMEFDEGVGPNLINSWLNHWGPMYLVNINGKDYLYQDRGDYEMFIDEEGFDYVDNEIPEEIGIGVLGLRFSDIIDMYFYEEDQI